MSYTIEIKPSGHQYEVEEGETILEAGLRHGFNLPYSCRGGSCGACKGKVMQGSFFYEDEDIFGISDEEKQQNLALFCQAVPTSDMVIEVKEIGANKDIIVKTLPCRVEKMEKLADDVMRIYLKLPQSERLQFLAGQYIEILLKDGRRRAFSMANAPHNDALLELHIRDVGGHFTQHVFNEMQEKALLRFEGPLGSFFYREDSDKPMIMMAGGTGFAPIKAIVEHVQAQGINREIYLYWGARDRASLYLHELAQNWAEEIPQLTYVPVLSEAKESDQWQGRQGFVHEAILEDFDDLSAYEVYACGPPVMIDAGKQAFIKHGLEPDCYYTDAFTFAKD